MGAVLLLARDSAPQVSHNQNMVLQALGPPVERLVFFCSHLSRGTLPTKKGVRKGTLAGDLEGASPKMVKNPEGGRTIPC